MATATNLQSGQPAFIDVYVKVIYLCSRLNRSSKRIILWFKGSTEALPTVERMAAGGEKSRRNT